MRRLESQVSIRQSELEDAESRLGTLKRHMGELQVLHGFQLIYFVSSDKQTLKIYRIAVTIQICKLNR